MHIARGCITRDLDRGPQDFPPSRALATRLPCFSRAEDFNLYARLVAEDFLRIIQPKASQHDLLPRA